MTELSEHTKKQLRELKEQYPETLEYWAKSGNKFEKRAANLILGVQA